MAKNSSKKLISGKADIFLEKSAVGINRKSILFALCVLTAVTLIAMFPSLKNDFTIWDDDRYITENPLIRDLSSEGIESIATTIVVGNYHPLTIVSYAFEYHFFQLNPAAYHTTNLILHIVNCLLVFWLVILLSKNLFTAFITAILFGIHPLHVESVAWISERKDLLYTLFFLASLVSYLFYLKENKGKKYYILSLLLFILSCLSKGMAVILPAILLIIDYLQGRKINMYTLKEKLPFIIVSIVFGIVAIISQRAAGAISGEEIYSIVDRLFIASYGVLFYIYKSIVPVGLSCLYPYPSKAGGNLPMILYIAPFIIAGVVLLLRKWTKYRTQIVFGGLFYLFCLLPVLQLLPVGYAIVADRYFYLSSVGIFFIVGKMYAPLLDPASAIRPVLRKISIGLFAIIVIVFTVLSWQRSAVWQNSITLFENAVEQYPQVASLHNNLGMAYAIEGDVMKEMDSYRRAIEIDSTLTKPYMNMATRYGVMEEYDKAISCYQKVVSLKPDLAIAYLNMGILYAKKGNDSLGVTYVQKAARLGDLQSQQWLQSNNYTW